MKAIEKTASLSLRGSCHCGNLSYELTTNVPAAEIRARACDCRFCRIHAAANWSDPAGLVIIRAIDTQQLQKYRFALKTADFYLCRTCGSYLGAVLEDETGAWATINLRLADTEFRSKPASYGAEDTAARIERRRRLWTPAKIILGDHLRV